MDIKRIALVSGDGSRLTFDALMDINKLQLLLPDERILEIDLDAHLACRARIIDIHDYEARK